VSPLWRDEVAILIAPRQLVLTRMSRGLRPRCSADLRRPVDESVSLDWRPALKALANCLSEAGWQDANARVVLANHWARYAVVPWANDIANEEERLAHARICLANIYGNVAEQWRIGLSHAAPGAARIACAVEDDLIDEVSAAASAHGLRVVSVQPQLVASFNGWRHKLEDASGWFVNIDEGALAAARLVGGGWDRVYSARIGTDWSLELQRLRTFGRLAARHSENGRVFVAAPTWLRKLAADGDVGIEWLEDEDRGAGEDEDLSVLKRLYA
jgi:hypothetical protein